MAKGYQVTIHVAERDCEALDKIAVLEGRSRNDLINTLIAQFLWGQQAKLRLLRGEVVEQMHNKAE